jgi:hypothetical protein
VRDRRLCHAQSGAPIARAALSWGRGRSIDALADASGAVRFAVDTTGGGKISHDTRH